jgi:hypothetical protein
MVSENEGVTRKNQIRLYDLNLMDEKKLKPDKNHIIVDMSLKKVYCIHCKKEKKLNIEHNELNIEIIKEIKIFKLKHKNCKT